MRIPGLLLCILALQDADPVEKLLHQVDSENIEQREAASKALIQMGMKARPRIEAAARTGTAEHTARLKSILDAIDLQPGALPHSLDAILVQHCDSFHQLVRHASHRVRSNFQGKEWGDIKRVLDEHRVPLLKSSDCGSRGEYESDHTYVYKRGAWRTTDGISFDLRLEFNTKIRVTPRERSRNVVESAMAVWHAGIDKPLATLWKERPFPKGTILDAMLDFAGIRDEAAAYPRLKEIRISYSFESREWISTNEQYCWNFDVDPRLLSEDGKSGCSPSLHAPSGLDPPLKEGKPDPAWISKDTLGPLRSDGGRKWGRNVAQGFPADHVVHAGSWTLEKPGMKKAAGASAEPVEFRAYNGPDLAAVPRDVEYLMILFPDLEASDLAPIASLPKVMEIYIESKKLTADALQRLAAIATLARLSFWTEESNPPECFEKLAAMPLELLHIGHRSGLNDEAMEAISRSRKLKTLILNGMDEVISDRGMASLAKLTGLEHLELWSFHQATSASVASLAPMKSLRSLTLAYLRAMDDGGLKAIGGMSSIESLTIIECGVSDAGLPEVERLEKLNRFDVKLCRKVTKEGVEKLRERHPGRLEFQRKD